MLPFGMTLDDLKTGVSKIRNPVIVRVLRELDYMEKWGTGYKRIIEDCDSGGYPHPTQDESAVDKGNIDQVGIKLALSRHQVLRIRD